MGTTKVTFVQDAVNKASERKWTTYVNYFFVGFGLIAAFQAYSFVLKTVIKRPDYVEKAVPVFFLLIAIEALIDYYSGKKYYRLNDSINSIFQGVFSVYSGYFIKWFRIIPYAYVHENYAMATLDYSWLSWLVAFMAIDFGYYWFHRMGHEVNLFWASHMPHHSSQEYNLTTALRQGAYQTWFSWVFYVPLALFVPLDHFYVCEAVTTLYQFWIHTRYISKLPWIIEYIFNTPSHHRVHHARNYKYLDKNYAGTLIIWDRMFGSFEPEQEEVVYGVTHDLGTWNPFLIQFHHLYETYISTHFVSGIYNKYRVFFDFGPSFNGEVLYPHESSNPPLVTPENIQKYDGNMPNFTMTLYGLFHSTLLIGSTLILGKIVAGNPFSLLGIVYTLYVIFGIFVMSAMYDGREWAKYAEVVRMVAMPIVLVEMREVASIVAVVSIGIVLSSYKSTIKSN